MGLLLFHKYLIPTQKLEPWFWPFFVYFYFFFFHFGWIVLDTLKNAVVGYRAKQETEGRHECKEEWASLLSFLSLDFASWVDMLFISGVYCRRLFFPPFGHEILVISINKEIPVSFQPRSEKAGWVLQGLLLISDRYFSPPHTFSPAQNASNFLSFVTSFHASTSPLWPSHVLRSVLDLHSSLTKKIFSQLPSEAWKPVTVLSQARRFFSVPQCQQWGMLFGCALGADYFRPAQYWLCEQDTGLITFLNGWYGSKNEGAGIPNGTSCHFPFPYYPQPWLWEMILEVTSTYHHFSSIGMGFILLSEQAFPTCSWHSTKAMPSLTTWLSSL